MADPISAAIGAVATIGGGMMSSSAAGKAASTQADAAREAGALQAASARESLDFQREMYGQQRADIAPYRQAGLTAQNRLLTLLGLAPTADTMAPPTTFDEEGYNRAVDAYYACNSRPVQAGQRQYFLAPGLLPIFSVGKKVLGEVYIQPKRQRLEACRCSWCWLPWPCQPVSSSPQQCQSIRCASIKASPDFGRYARDFSMQDFEQDPRLCLSHVRRS
jgi:hypothetical protein